MFQVNVSVSCAGICPARKTISSQQLDETTTTTTTTSTTPTIPDLTIHSLEEFNDALQVNTLGAFNLARLSAERMALRKPDAEGLRGCIINTASIAAFEGQTGQVAYAASKGAIVGMLSLSSLLSLFLSLLLRKRIHLLLICVYMCMLNDIFVSLCMSLLMQIKINRHDITTCKRFIKIWYPCYDDSTWLIQNSIVRWIIKYCSRKIE